MSGTGVSEGGREGMKAEEMKGRCEYCIKMRVDETGRWYRHDCPYPCSNITMRGCFAWEYRAGVKG